MRVLTLVFAAAVALPVAQPPAQTSAPSPKGYRLADLTWTDAESLLKPDSVVVIPLGAGSSEHGMHLKLGNDMVLAEYLTRRVLDASNVVVAPALPYHFYPAFVEYSGSTTLNLETARTMTQEVVRGLARFGPRRFYVLNTGLSTSRALEPAAATLAREGVLLTYTDLATRLDQAAAKVRRQDGGTHADEVETSMMLYAEPSAVDMTRAMKELNPVSTPFRLTRTRGGAGTYSASGVWGDPTLATREKGQVIVESLVVNVLQDIEALRKAPLPVPGSLTEPSAAPRSAPSGRGPAGPSGCTPGDERSILNIAAAHGTHWANADALQLSGLWSDEGDMVHPDGLTERGRKVIFTNRIEMFQRKEYKGSRHILTFTNLRCLSADVAVVDGKWELRGVMDAAGAPLPLFEGLCTVVVKRTGGWFIEAYRYTIKPSSKPLPVWLSRPGWAK